ncbi:hypothetical protein [Desulfobotulus sp.]|uniref:hypothetical protein n=1 Tax=Desulfobotulus sp. TaxID=1940337 RepID=UPI002A36AD95|nr:hypothetical protein [Desulfobotulus sp.]MDY0164318.1 hypothetical protein [Desulfobotulus sp.]
MKPSCIFDKYGAMAPAYSPANDGQAAREDMRSQGLRVLPASKEGASSGTTPDPSPDARTGGLIGQPEGIWPSPSPVAGGQNWRECPTVMELSRRLKGNRHGVRLWMDEAEDLHLSIRPGVSPDEPERWEFYGQALRLVELAMPDLRRLLAAGALTLPRC